MHRLPDCDVGKERLREEIICGCAPVARRLALRFRNRGEELDDLTQVATIGLIKAVDRYQPDRGVPFASYVLPTMLGEIKRYFRDRTWTLHVQRSLQELHLAVCKAVPELSQQLQRTPTVDDLAEHLGVRAEQVRAALDCAGAYTAGSLNAPVGEEGGEGQLMDLLGDVDGEVESLPDRDALRQAIDTLPERERRILQLRFVDCRTQTEIAEEVGVSQMHVSRLLTRALAALRDRLTDETD
ncbi:SigB/SigF/SigG family RNA polymerase sigma factor [Catellatospora sp. KI3]|uniref:SigB/SigF/SigG family RNA polymerase sigma factor n=1 Tax=Catellatospora sp. KI3 TaxID=3041620 RepID=UPI0024824EE6|nr:SigB/SigF/SigG family RNA polymerase sigma factor [Catellatospora sp. KI3]MDI1462681.1 SigB/SigF/SigG family RNA polymerase sigma factor [Catellatospora sp. KI3]